MLACFGLAGCGTPVLAADSPVVEHQIALRVTATDEAVVLTAEVNGRRQVTDGATEATATSTTSVATLTVQARSGAHITLAGGPSGEIMASGLSSIPAKNAVTCSISVDGIERATKTVAHPLGELPECHLSGYIGHRALAVRRIFEFIALALCLLIVFVAIGAQLVTSRQP